MELSTGEITKTERKTNKENSIGPSWNSTKESLLITKLKGLESTTGPMARFTKENGERFKCTAKA
jgi:hypothetical protein